MGTRKLWGRTMCANVPVTIYLSATLRAEHDCDGETVWQNGTMEVEIAQAASKMPKRFGQLLIHELTHVVEYANDPRFLDPTCVDDCTALAQTMEVCLGGMLLNMRLAPGAKWPFLPSRIAAKSSKR